MPALQSNDNKTPNVLIFGTGGVGGVYAYILRHANVTTVCRSNYDAVQQHGISISSKLYGDVHAQPTHVVRSVADAKGPFDFVVVTAKAIPAKIPAAIAPAVTSPSTAIVLAQNGIAIEAEYAAAFPNNPIISGVVYLPVTQTAPGHVQMGNLERIELGTYPAAGASEAAKGKVIEFAELFKHGGGDARVYEDVQELRWSKLMVNTAWNPTCALAQLDDASFLRSSDEAKDMVKKIMMEVVAVAQAKGFKSINEENADWQLSRAVERLQTGGIEPSMLADVKAGREMEVEAIVGNTVRIAKEVGVKVPMLEMLYALAKALDYSLGLKR